MQSYPLSLRWYQEPGTSTQTCSRAMNPDMPWQQPRPNNHHGRGWQASHAPQSAPRHFNFFTYVPLHRTRTILSLSLSYTHLLTVVVTSYLCFLLCSQGRLPGHACTAPCPCGHSRECRCCQRLKEDIRSPGQSYRQLWTDRHGCWELNLNPLEKQQVLLVPGPPLPLKEDSFSHVLRSCDILLSPNSSHRRNRAFAFVLAQLPALTAGDVFQTSLLAEPMRNGNSKGPLGFI